LQFICDSYILKITDIIEDNTLLQINYIISNPDNYIKYPILEKDNLLNNFINYLINYFSKIENLENFYEKLLLLEKNNKFNDFYLQILVIKCHID